MPFGNYFLDYEIASGGMGTVYFAKQLSMDREVAVKVLSRHAMSMPGVLERFRSEAVLAGRLRHPSIVEVYETGEHQGIYYIAMELISGVSMSDLVAAKGVLGLDEAVYYLRSIADALAYASQSGTIHKDVKPLNILIDGNDLPRLTDFGLAEVVSGEGSAQIVGTPSYIAPEVIRGRPADQRADIYSFGCTLYHTLCGEPPFNGSTLRETLKLHLTTPPRPPIAIRPRIPQDRNDFVLSMLEKDRELRLQNWGQVLFRMDRLVAEHGWTIKEHVPCPECTKPMRRNDVICTRCGLNVKTGGRLPTLGSVRPRKLTRPRGTGATRVTKGTTSRSVSGPRIPAVEDRAGRPPSNPRTDAVSPTTRQVKPISNPRANAVNASSAGNAKEASKPSAAPKPAAEKPTEKSKGADDAQTTERETDTQRRTRSGAQARILARARGGARRRRR
jgi:serine/threonine protein kinase